MTLANESRAASGASEYDRDRMPPQSVEAEQSVLGSMMLSKDAIADVVEVVRPGDFYRPAHQLVYDAILDLYARGEPADAITVAAELTHAGQLIRVGGAPYLHTLISLVPTAANAGYYARIVAERATLRRLVVAGTRIVQMGYETASGSTDVSGTVDDVVDRAQAEIYEVTERRTSEDFVHIESLLQSTLDEIDKISATGGVGTGIPTGFQQLDEYTNGLHPGQMITIAGRPGTGKALAVDTPLPTPTGWTTMGNVRVGDLLLGADGRPTPVVAATEVMRDRPCYEVEFSDGTVIVADAEHQWCTSTRASRRARADRSDRFLLPAVGGEFRVPVQRKAWALGSSVRAWRPIEGQRNSRARRSGPACARQALTAAVAQRVGRPTNSWTRSQDHDIRTTEEIARSLRCYPTDGRPNHAVSCAEPLVLPEADLPLAPYLLGTWLGDGTTAATSLTCADEQMSENIRTEGIVVASSRVPTRHGLRLPELERPARSCEVCGAEFRPGLLQARTCGTSCAGLGARNGSVQARLRTVGVLDVKHIPALYLRANESQRRSLLAGLLDTDGYATSRGTLEIGVTTARLASDIRELVVSLGYRAELRTKQVRGRTGPCYTIAFASAERVFGIDRKVHRQHAEVRAGARTRFIVDVRRVPSVPVRCVQVANAAHMYLAGRTMVPTHNSTLALDIARSASIKHGKPSVIFSLEMSRVEIMMRLFSAEATVSLQNMRSGHMSDQDWTRLARRSSELAEAPLFIDDSPNLTMMEIRAKARRLRQRHDLQLVVIDYLQLMTSNKRVETRQQEVSEFSRAMKLLAKELDVPVIALSQLNRGPEQRTDKKPLLSDLRESGSIEQDSDVVLLVHRPDLYEPETERAGEADLILAKHRNGPTATCAVAFQGRYSRFADMPS